MQHEETRIDRRDFLTRTGMGLGALALGQLLSPFSTQAGTLEDRIMSALPRIAPRAKKVVFLFMAGGPSQFETFDYKPGLSKIHGTHLPDSVRRGQRLTGMSGNQAVLPVASSPYRFSQHGKSRTWVSELLPYTAQVVDELCVIRSMHTEQINHDPAITFFQTGHQLPGRPSIGSWIDSRT